MNLHILKRLLGAAGAVLPVLILGLGLSACTSDAGPEPTNDDILLIADPMQQNDPDVPTHDPK